MLDQDIFPRMDETYSFSGNWKTLALNMNIWNAFPLSNKSVYKK